HLAGDRPGRGQEPRGPPDARQTRAQGDATEAPRHRPDPPRQAGQGQVASPRPRGGGAPPGHRPARGDPEEAGEARGMTPVHGSFPVVENVPLAERTWRVRLEAPELARAIRPGQFLMLRLPGRSDPLLGRPFALYDTYPAQGEPRGVDIVYLVVGKM